MEQQRVTLSGVGVSTEVEVSRLAFEVHRYLPYMSQSQFVMELLMRASRAPGASAEALEIAPHALALFDVLNDVLKDPRARLEAELEDPAVTAPLFAEIAHGQAQSTAALDRAEIDGRDPRELLLVNKFWNNLASLWKDRPELNVILDLRQEELRRLRQVPPAE